MTFIHVKSPDFAPCLSPCSLKSPDFRSCFQISPDLRVISHKSNKNICFTAVMSWPKPIDRQLFAQNDH